MPVADNLSRRIVCAIRRPFLAAGRIRNLRMSLVAGLVLLMLAPLTAAFAIEPIVLGPDDDKIDITQLGEFYGPRGDKISVETAADASGTVSRMSVSAKTVGTNPSWAAFAVSNPTSKPILRWLTAQRYNIVGSKVVWPDLDAPRITNVTPSLGFRPERIEEYDFIDVYRISVEPGATVTFVVELASSSIPRLYLTTPASFGKKQRDFNLFQGILLGITGVLAVFVTAIFGVNHKAMFPAAALVAWSVLAYLCVDFGFWHKLFQISSDDNGTYRAAAEAALAASLVIFLYTFLNLRLWHAWISLVFFGWISIQLGLIGFALIDAPVTAGLARLSFVPIAGVGSAVMSFLALKGQERALSLLPGWMLFMVWLLGAAVTVLGKLSGDIAAPALSSGLVLFVAIITFTVTQYAFQAAEAGGVGEDAGQYKLRMMALQASGASVWDWDGRRDEIVTGPEVEAALGLEPNTLRAPVEEWLHHLHASDRERMRLLLWTLRERQGGDINVEFRMRRQDGGHLWYELRASAAPQRTTRALRAMGLMRNITMQKRAQERLLHNAIRDSLTGLPNRELFLDRLETAITRARTENLKPTVFFIDLDALKSHSRSPDFAANDTILLTVARRLMRHLPPHDTLARISPLQFGILMSADTEPRHIAMLAERVRRSLRTPMKVAGRDLVLTGSIGIAMYDGHQENAEELLREAESAMYRAKRAGADRIELYKPEMRGERDERALIRAELKHAIERRQILVLYQPIMRIANERLAGMEAFVLWDHPQLGRLTLIDFENDAEAAGLASELWGYVFERCIRQCARWHRILQRDDPLYVSINMTSQQLFHNDLVQNLRLIIGRETLPKGALRLEIAENFITTNPEQAIEVIDWLKSLNVSIALDEFGVSFSSLPYWHRLSVDAVKIDRLLLALSDKERSSGMVLKAVLTIAHELGKDVVAVGVDSEEDLAFARALGCDFGQGYFYSEMMTEREIVSLLNAIVRSSRRDDREKAREERRAAKRREKEAAQAVTPVTAIPASTPETPEPPPSGEKKPLPPPRKERPGKPFPSVEPARKPAMETSQVNKPLAMFEAVRQNPEQPPRSGGPAGAGAAGAAKAPRKSFGAGLLKRRREKT